jgi:hypothetical protein
VKFLGKLEATQSDQETREGWWAELRDEIKKSASSLCCSFVIGYSEVCTIFGECCVLSVYGTAASIKGLVHPTIFLKDHAEDPSQMGTVSAVTNTINNPPTGSRHQKFRRDKASFTFDDEDIEVGISATADDVNGNNNSENSSRRIQLPSHVSRSHSHELKWAGYADSSKRIHSSSRQSSLDDCNNANNISTSCIEDLNKKHSSQSRKPVMMKLSNIAARQFQKEPKVCFNLHVPYNKNDAPFAFMRLVPCCVCSRKWVPGNGCFIQ